MAHTPPGRTRARILAFVQDSLARGHAPTIREVQAGVGLRSPEGARQHLVRLVEEGRLGRAAGARSWRLPRHATTETSYVPLLGEVPAGNPLEALEEREGVLPIDARRMRKARGRLFALRVRGESMSGAALLPGDVVIVDPTAEAQHRDIVVARLGGEATVKRLWRSRGRIELRPENPAFQPIVPGAGEELEVLGRVIEVRRSLQT